MFTVESLIEHLKSFPSGAKIEILAPKEMTYYPTTEFKVPLDLSYYVHYSDEDNTVKIGYK